MFNNQQEQQSQDEEEESEEDEDDEEDEVDQDYGPLIQEAGTKSRSFIVTIDEHNPKKTLQLVKPPTNLSNHLVKVRGGADVAAKGDPYL